MENEKDLRDDSLVRFMILTSAEHQTLVIYKHLGHCPDRWKFFRCWKVHLLRLLDHYRFLHKTLAIACLESFIFHVACCAFKNSSKTQNLEGDSFQILTRIPLISLLKYCILGPEVRFSRLKVFQIKHSQTFKQFYCIAKAGSNYLSYINGAALILYFLYHNKNFSSWSWPIDQVQTNSTLADSFFPFHSFMSENWLNKNAFQ